MDIKYTVKVVFTASFSVIDYIELANVKFITNRKKKRKKKQNNLVLYFYLYFIF